MRSAVVTVTMCCVLLAPCYCVVHRWIDPWRQQLFSIIRASPHPVRASACVWLYPSGECWPCVLCVCAAFCLGIDRHAVLLSYINNGTACIAYHVTYFSWNLETACWKARILLIPTMQVLCLWTLFLSNMFLAQILQAWCLWDLLCLCCLMSAFRVWFID